MMLPIFETARLSAREFVATDTAFVQVLLNTPTWLEYVGDRDVHDAAAALGYIQKLQKSYQSHGFGLYLLQLKTDNTPIGMCGLVVREELDTPDIGFALLPAYVRQGYMFEAATATLHHAKTVLQQPKIIGLTTEDNVASIGVLEKIGLKYERIVALHDEDLLLFS